MFRLSTAGEAAECLRLCDPTLLAYELVNFFIDFSLTLLC
jgi:hypothetical protein